MRTRNGIGLQARQGEELVHQPDGLLDPRFQERNRLVPLLWALRTLEKLKLQLHAGQRRAQLVSRIRSETALAVQCLTQTQEEVVEGAHQRFHFVGRVLERDGEQGGGVALRDLLAQRPSGRNPRPTVIQVAMPRSGTMRSSGSISRRDIPCSAASLTSSDCATCTVRPCRVSA